MADRAWPPLYRLTILLLTPFNVVLCVVLGRRFRRTSVLHISEPVHVAWQTVETLRRHGIAADYLAIGHSQTWSRWDWHLRRLRWPFLSAMRDVVFFWRHMAGYEVVHCHFGISLAADHWDLALLRRLNRRVVVHFRGCEARHRARMALLYPTMNICQDCDYEGRACSVAEADSRRTAASFADVILVTTPDLRDFWPAAIHLPFCLPVPLPELAPPVPHDGDAVLVHVTNHPGIEGCSIIAGVVEALRQRGIPIRYQVISGQPHEVALAAVRNADLAIGKMKMGYYANAQIESALMGKPTLTWIRDDLLTEAVAASGLIVCSLNELESKLASLMSCREQWGEWGRRGRAGMLRLHGDEVVVADLRRCYGWQGDSP